MMKTETKRQKYEKLRAKLILERSSFISLWRDLADYILPRRPRFFVTDTNKADRRSTRIVDSTATMAADTLRSGISSGVTSPARDWKRLATPNPATMQNGKVKAWLDSVNEDMSGIFLRSNLYNSLPIVYGDIGVFGTGAMFVEEDFENVLHSTVFPIGSFMAGIDSKGRVNTFIRDFRMTVRQLVDEFGIKDSKGDVTNWENFSLAVKSLYEQGDLEAWVDVCHVIQPNEEYDDSKLNAKYKRFSSCYYERGLAEKSTPSTEMEDKYLRESGYDIFPVLLVRWETTGEDTYATNCPGMKALGDIKQLQVQVKRVAQAMEKMINPPMVGHTELQGQKVTSIPGDVTWAAETDGKPKFRPAYQINPPLAEMEESNETLRQRIRRVFFEPAITSFLNDQRAQPRTKAEVDQIAEEKLSIFGPVFQQLNRDLLDPLVEIAFSYMERQGRLPPPPDELEGVDLKIEYLSVMAQAQKRVGIEGLERTVQFIAEMANAKQDPTVWDKLDTDQTADVFSDFMSIPPGIIRSDEAVEEMRLARQKAQEEEQAAAELAAGAKAVKDLAGAQTEKPSALKELLQVA